MSNQRNDWHALADRITEMIQKYIDEKDAWDREPFLWVDGINSEVNIGFDDEEYPGEKNHVSFFIIEEGEGVMTPDYDKIDDYSSGWFDLRQG